MQYTMDSFDDLERIVAEELELMRTNASGSVSGNCDSMHRKQKGHVETYDDLMVECKYTEKIPGTLSIKRADWNKTKRAAATYGRLPVMATGDKSGDIVIHIPLHVFRDILLRSRTN